MSMNLVTLLYLIASVCFIQSLKGLSHPTTSIRGNVFGMVGMAIAAFTTAALIVKLAGHGMGLVWVLLGLVLGGGFGAWKKAGGPVEMSEEVWDAQVDFNLKSVFRLIGLVSNLVLQEVERRMLRWKRQ